MCFRIELLWISPHYISIAEKNRQPIYCGVNSYGLFESRFRSCLFSRP